MPKLQSLVDRATLGASGRVWRLPFDAVTYGDPCSVTFHGPLERDCAALACELVRGADPKLFQEWRAAFIAKCRASACKTESPHTNCLTSESPTSPRNFMMATASVRAPAPPPPQKVDVPQIDPDHWYYKRHYTVGSYRAPVELPDSEKLGEVAQDIASLRFYLESYNALAQEIGGHRLFEATTWALFKAPYFSCMEMCIRDLALPSHFLAFIHHGIGAHLAIGQPYLSWNHRTASEEDRHCLRKTQEVFNLIARLYREDFGIGGGASQKGAA